MFSSVSKYLVVGIRSLLLHKLQSGLSVLGIIFGVAAVIVALAIGGGARREVLDAMQLMGMNNITVRPVADAERAAGGRELPYAVARNIRIKLAPSLEGFAPQKYRERPVAAGGREIQARVVGTGPDFRRVYRLLVKEGRFLADRDLAGRAKICVLGMDVKKALFPLRSPVGELVRVGPDWLRVVGWLENKDLPRIKADVVKFHDTNRDVYLPYTTAVLAMDGREAVDEIGVRVAPGERVEEVAEVLDTMLAETEGYRVVIPRELLRQSQRARRLFNAVMAGIASISLLVGGIGIMNIMLATVSERIREVGIRRAMGATRGEIVHQFLTEAVLLTLTGGIIGILLGGFAALVISRSLDWRVALAWDTVLLAVSISTGVGIVFGIYPAHRAARLDPVAALRHE